MQFSVSATNRSPRAGEVNGVSYHFMTTEAFQEAVTAGEFIEWEEVYPGRFYGTLRSEVDRVIDTGHNVVLDIDVKGALNVKRIYGGRALTIFIEPPSIDELRRRLEGRGTETAETIAVRIGKAEYELGFAADFDVRVVNDDLERAICDTRKVITDFINA